MPEEEGTFLTVRQMVVEIRNDVKELKIRVGSLERDGFRFKGVGSGIVLSCAVIAGVGGLILGASAHF